MLDNNRQKLYRFEVDQSGRVEEMNRPTVIAVANKEQAHTLLLPARTKRRLYEDYRKTGKTKQFAPQVFTTALILTLMHGRLRF